MVGTQDFLPLYSGNLTDRKVDKKLTKSQISVILELVKLYICFMLTVDDTN